MLQAGRELLIERGVDLGLRNIPVIDAAARAGRSSGAAYQIWHRQADFHRELALSAVQDETWGDSNVVVEAAGELLINGAPMRQALSAAADAYLEHLVGSRSFFVFVHFWAVALDDPEVRDAIKAGYERFHADFVLLYQALLDHYTLEIRPPFTIDDLAVAFSALAEGFALRRGTDRERTDRRLVIDEQEWGLFGATLDAVVAHFVRPRAG